jgi:hypothetical protein
MKPVFFIIFAIVTSYRDRRRLDGLDRIFAVHFA